MHLRCVRTLISSAYKATSTACSAVRDILFPPRNSQKAVRAANDGDLISIMHIHTTNDWTSLLTYREPLVRAAIMETKFYGNQKAAHMLGLVLREFLANGFCEESVQIIVPVPLSRVRRNERGYNQVERVCTAAPLEATMSAGLLRRHRNTYPQTSLTAVERQENLQDAFICVGIINPAHTYIVIDDVVTTGATLAAARAALRLAGAEHVFAVALAHQPRNGTV